MAHPSKIPDWATPVSESKSDVPDWGVEVDEPKKKSGGGKELKSSSEAPLSFRRRGELPTEVKQSGGSANISKPKEIAPYKFDNKPVSDNVMSGSMRQQQSIKQDVAKKDIEYIEKGRQKDIDVQVKKIKEEPISTEPAFDGVDFMKQDIIQHGGGKSLSEMPSNLESLNLYFGNDANNAADYFKQRTADIDSEIKDLLTSKQQSIKPSTGDIATGVNKPQIDPLTGKPFDNSTPEEKATDERIRELNDYKNKLAQAQSTLAKKYAGWLAKDADVTTKGKVYDRIMGDEYAAEQQRLEDKGIPITQEQKYNTDMKGLEVSVQELNDEYEGKSKDDMYYERLADLELMEKGILNKYPEYKRQQGGKLIAQLAVKDKNVRIAAETGSGELDKELKTYLEKTYGINPKDLKGLDYGDIPSETFMGNIAKGITEAATGVLTGVTRIGGTVLGIDEDRITSINENVNKLGSNVFGDNPYAKLQESETLVNRDLREISNPNAGKYNYNAETIKNAIGSGIGGLVGFIGGMKGTGKLLSLSDDAAMTSYLIGSGFEHNYQKANEVMGKDASEVSKGLYATGMGYLEALAFKVLPKDKIFFGSAESKAAQKELAKTLSGVTLETVNKEALESGFKKVLKAAAGTTEETAKIGGAMTIAEMAKTATAVLLGDEKDTNKFIEEGVSNIGHLVRDLPFSMGIPLGLMEIPKYVQHSNRTKQILFDAGNNPDTHIATIRQAQEKGLITPEQADKKIEVVETMKNIVKSLPDKNPKTGEPLTQKQQAEYAYNRVKEIAVKTKADEIKDAALAPFYKKEAQELVDERTAIVTGTHDAYKETAALADRIKETGKQKIITDVGTKTQLVTTLQEQALSTPISTKRALEDAELTSDLIARNEPTGIKAELKKLKDEHKKLIENEKKAEANEVQKSIDLLEAGLGKQKKPKVEDTKLSEPVEGLNEQGIPKGENVPTPTELTPSKEVVPDVVVERVPKKLKEDDWGYEANKELEKQLGVKLNTEDLIVNGENIGFVTVAKKEGSGNFIQKIELNKDNVGKGYGEKIYTDLNEQSLKETGLPLSSSDFKDMGSNSIKFWDKLVGKGVAVKNENNYSFKEQSLSKEQPSKPFELPTKKDEVNNVPLLKNADGVVNYIPKSVVEKAYENDAVNKNRTGGAQTLERIIQRGGYDIREMDRLYPEWRKEVEKLNKPEQPSNKQEVVEPKPEIKNEEAKVTEDTKPTTEKVSEQPVVSEPASEAGGGKKEPPKEPTEPVGEGGDKKDGITHAAVAELRKLVELTEYEGKPKETHEALIKEAQETIKNDPSAADKVIRKMENDGEITNKDNAIAAVYKATLDAALEKTPTKELLDRARRLAKALDISGTKLGKALESRKLVGQEDNITNFLLGKEAAQGTTLSETQIKSESAKYEELKTAKEALEVELQKERESHARDIAEMGLNKARAKARREAKKSNEDYKTERKASVEAARKALKEIRDNPQASAAPVFRELVAIAPHVKDFINSLVSEGVDKLDNIITSVHAEFKDVLEGLSNRNVLDIIAGDYDVAPKEKTKNEKLNTIRLLKREAELIKQLERERKGEEKAKTEQDKTTANRRIDELKKKIQEVRRLNKDRVIEDEGVNENSGYAKLKEEAPKEDPPKQPLTAEEKNIQRLEKELEDLQVGIAKQKNPKRDLTDREKELKEQIFEARAKMGLVASKAVKEPISDNAKEQDKLDKKIKKLEEDVRTKKYLEEPTKPPVFRKNRKTQLLEDKVIDLENKIRHERSKDEYNKRGKARRFFDGVMQVLGVRRLVQSALDMSVPFRQGATMISPRKFDVWLKGFQANLQSVLSPKKFERIMHEIRKDPDYHDMGKDNIVFNDLGSADPNLHNEDFRKSFVYKIPILSEPLKASNRSADAFLNVTRYEMYKKMRKVLEKKGLTRESDPMAFKHMGNFVMSMTGRGKMNKIFEGENMSNVLGNTFYGARLMASRFNLLNPVTYLDPKVPRQAKIEAFKDLASFTGTMMVVGSALAYGTGAKVSLDPEDSDFLQLRYGNKVYDISGGLATYVRTFLRMTNAIYAKATEPKYQGKEAIKKGGKSFVQFFRNKLSPNTAYVMDAIFGKSYGEDFDPSEIYRIYPMYTEDVIQSWKDEGGLMSLGTVLLPNIVGIGYGSYASKGQIDANLEDLLERNLRSDEMNSEKIINHKEKRPVTYKEFNEYADKRDAYIEKELTEFFEKGLPVVENGTVKYKPYKDLTQDEVIKETTRIKSEATRKVKEEMFGKVEKTSQEKKDEKKLKKFRKNN